MSEVDVCEIGGELVLDQILAPGNSVSEINLDDIELDDADDDDADDEDESGEEEETQIRQEEEDEDEEGVEDDEDEEDDDEDDPVFFLGCNATHFDVVLSGKEVLATYPLATFELETGCGSDG